MYSAVNLGGKRIISHKREVESGFEERSEAGLIPIDKVLMVIGKCGISDKCVPEPEKCVRWAGRLLRSDGGYWSANAIRVKLGNNGTTCARTLGLTDIEVSDAGIVDQQS